MLSQTSTVPYHPKHRSWWPKHDCMICGSKAIGINFGAPTCAPCKGIKYSMKYMKILVWYFSFLPSECSAKRRKRFLITSFYWKIYMYNLASTNTLSIPGYTVAEFKSYQWTWGGNILLTSPVLFIMSITSVFWYGNERRISSDRWRKRTI